MALTIATWNINSVRLRIDLVRRVLADHGPDVLCLQETKVIDDAFPRAAFEEAGYPHQVLFGQKNHHGVAIVARQPMQPFDRVDWCLKGDARHVRVRLESGLILDNFYVPAGGDEPDAAINPRFEHKLAFLDEMADWSARHADEVGRILVGDLNVAPLEHDVWSHKQLLKVVSHTPEEVERLDRVMAAGNWHDAMRGLVPPDRKLYTWWSYRNRDWAASDRGRRLDHVWVSRDLAPRVSAMTVLREARDWDKPSDHVPVLVTLNDRE